MIIQKNSIVYVELMKYFVFKALKTSSATPKVLYEIWISPEEQLTGALSEDTLNKVSESIERLCDDKTAANCCLENYLFVQTVPDKAIADCVEALIGVYLKVCGLCQQVRMCQYKGKTWKGTMIKHVNMKGRV